MAVRCFGKLHEDNTLVASPPWAQHGRRGRKAATGGGGGGAGLCARAFSAREPVRRFQILSRLPGERLWWVGGWVVSSPPLSQKQNGGLRAGGLAEVEKRAGKREARPGQAPLGEAHGDCVL